MEKKSVVVFTSNICPWCDRIKKFLREKKVSFKEVDVGVNQKAAQEMIEKSGQMGVPQIEINGKMIVGFDREAIEKELKKVKK